MEQRQHSRVKDPVVLVKVASLDKFRSYYLKDLSAGGIFIRCEKTLPMGCELDVKLVAPGLEEPLVLHGRVHRVATDEAAAKTGTTGMGIRFEGLPPETSARLASLIALHSGAAAAAAAAPAPLPVAAAPAPATGPSVAALEHELSAAHAALQARDALLDAKQRELSETLGQYQVLSHTTDELRGACAALEAELERMRSEAAAAPGSADLQQLREESDRLRTANADLEARLAEQEGQLQAYRSELQTMESDEATTRLLAERLAREKAGLERSRSNELETARAEALAARTEVHAAQGEAQALREHAEATAQQAAELHAELELSRQHAQDLTAQLESAHFARDAADKALAAEREARARSEARLATVERELERLRASAGKATEAERELAALRQKAASDHARAESLERQLGEARAQTERARAKERELRRLMSVVAAQEDEVVVETPSPSGEFAIPEAVELAPEAAEPAPVAAELAPEPEAFEPAPAMEAEAPAPEVTLSIEPEPAPMPTAPVDQLPLDINATDEVAALFGGFSTPGEPKPPQLTPPPMALPASEAPRDVPFDPFSAGAAPEPGPASGDAPDATPAMADTFDPFAEPTAAAPATFDPFAGETVEPQATPAFDPFAAGEPAPETSLATELAAEGASAPAEEDEVDIAIDEDEPTDASTVAIDFREHLLSGWTLVPTDKLATFEAPDNEARVLALLGAVDNYGQLLTLAKGVATEEELIEYCFSFHQKGLIELREPA